MLSRGLDESSEGVVDEDGLEERLDKDDTGTDDGEDSDDVIGDAQVGYRRHQMEPFQEEDAGKSDHQQRRLHRKFAVPGRNEAEQVKLGEAEGDGAAGEDQQGQFGEEEYEAGIVDGLLAVAEITTVGSEDEVATDRNDCEHDDEQTEEETTVCLVAVDRYDVTGSVCGIGRSSRQRFVVRVGGAYVTCADHVITAAGASDVPVHLADDGSGDEAVLDRAGVEILGGPRR